jgi:hypothetical protein
MSPERQRALDDLRHHQAKLAYWRSSCGGDGPHTAYLRRWVTEALDRYWGVISREEALHVPCPHIRERAGATVPLILPSVRTFGNIIY